MNKSLLKNISLNFLMRIISYIFSFLTIAYVTRTLLPEIYGRVSFVQSVSGYFIIFANLGMPIYGMRTCAQYRDNRKKLSEKFNELLSLNILFAIIAIITLILSVYLVPALRVNSTLIMAYSIGIILQAIGCEWLFKGLEKFEFLTLVAFIVKLFTFTCILLFVHSGKDMLIYVLLAVIAAYGSNLIYFINLHKHVDFSFQFTIRKEHIKALFIFFMMSCAVSIYNSLDITMLGFMTNNIETGLYTIAAKIKIFLAMTGGIVCTALLPNSTKLWKNGQQTFFFRLAEKSIMVVCLIQILLAIFCFFFAKQIILFVGGENYINSVTPFRILLLSLFPIGFSNILGELILIPCGLERQLLKSEIVGAIVNFLLNLIVIPTYAGIGAAITTVLSEFIVLILCIYHIKCILKIDFGITMLYKSIKIIRIFIYKLKICYIKTFHNN